MPARKAHVNVAEAKRSLSELLGRVAYGRESITILKRGRPMARLVPVDPQTGGALADFKGWLADDDPFFEVMDRILAERHARPARVVRRRT